MAKQSGLGTKELIRRRLRSPEVAMFVAFCSEIEAQQGISLSTLNESSLRGYLVDYLQGMRLTVDKLRNQGLWEQAHEMQDGMAEFESKAGHYMNLLSDPSALYLFVGNEPLGNYDFLGLIGVSICMDNCDEAVRRGAVLGCVNQWLKKCYNQCLDDPNAPPPLPIAPPSRRPGVNHGFGFLAVLLAFLAKYYRNSLGGQRGDKLWSQDQ